MELMISSSALEEEYNRTKIKLGEIEENLKIGFNFSRNHDYSSDKRKQDLSPKFDPRKEKHDLSPRYLTKFDPRKRAKVDEFKLEKSPGELEEDSDISDDTPEISIHSVVKNVKNNQSRRDIIREQNVNPKVESRNRRIFGMLQGTLRKFKVDAEKSKPQDQKRVQIEQKVEAAAVEERRKEIKLREELLQKRKLKQSHLSYLEKMIDVTESFEIWENNQKNMLNFMITETKPSVFFLPSSHISSTKRQHEKSKIKFLDSILKRKLQLIEELAEIKETHLKRFTHTNEHCESHKDDGDDAEKISSLITEHSDVLEDQSSVSSDLQLEDDKFDFA